MTIAPSIPASLAVVQIDTAHVDATTEEGIANHQAVDDEEYSRLTREALNEVDAGNVIDHQSV